MGASVKEKRFHTPLFKAVPQTSLRYAMGASVEIKNMATVNFYYKIHYKEI